VTATTVNGGLIIPGTGELVGVWGSNAVNPNFVSIDGLFGGVTTISAAASPIVLTSPAGFTPTPSAGPTQAQNAVLKFTGTLTANVQVTLPLPGSYIVDNQTTGAFVLSFRAIGSGQIIAVDQQDTIRIYNDGTNVRFVNLGRIGETAMWAGLTAMPAWVTACTNVPYLLCDGSVYNVSAFPSLGAKLLGKFGGNGITTFAVPDSEGRIQLPFDGTGTRITAAGCGLNGQTIGAILDEQTIQIAQSGLPNVTVSVDASTAVWNTVQFTTGVATAGGAGPFNFVNGINNGGSAGGTNIISKPGLSGGAINVAINGGQTQTATPNVQPSQITGIMVIRAG
jgi:microcystin-dependent protein